MDKGFARRVHALYVRRLPSAGRDLRGELFQPSPNARCTEYRLGTPKHMHNPPGWDKPQPNLGSFTAVTVKQRV